MAGFYRFLQLLLLFIYLLELSDENRDFYLPGGGITKKLYEAW